MLHRLRAGCRSAALLAPAAPAAMPHGAAGTADEILLIAVVLALFAGYVWWVRRSFRRRGRAGPDASGSGGEPGAPAPGGYNGASAGAVEPPGANKEAQ